MLAVTAAMVVPSIQTSGGSVVDEAERMRIIMRLAADEAQFTGAPMRAILKKDEYSFEAWQQGKENGEWFALADTQFRAYVLPQNINILAIEQVVNYTNTFALDEDEVAKEDILGYILFLPDGTLSQLNIRLGNKDDTRLLEVRPGPQGVRLKPQDESY